MSFEKELLSDMRVYKPIEANWFIFKAKIEEYCLDKAKVRETIMKHIDESGLGCTAVNQVCWDLLQELRLTQMTGKKNG